VIHGGEFRTIGDTWYRRSRLTPVEGRSPGSGMLWKEAETGHCRKARTQLVEHFRKKLYDRAKWERKVFAAKDQVVASPCMLGCEARPRAGCGKSASPVR
jgi:hypothetical protein